MAITGSMIDATKPTAVNPSTQSVRDNFQIAKDEIGGIIVFGTQSRTTADSALADAATAITNAAAAQATANSANANANQALLDAADANAAVAAAMSSKGISAVLNPFTSTGLVEVAHGLPSAPDGVDMYAECIVADYGYSIGDRVKNPGYYHTATWNATTLKILTSGNALVFPQKTGGATTGMTASSWKLVATPYLIK